jgi:hypothetical protein
MEEPGPGTQEVTLVGMEAVVGTVTKEMFPPASPKKRAVVWEPELP